MRIIILTALLAALAVAGCYASSSSHSDVTVDHAADAYGETDVRVDVDVMADPDLPGEPDAPAVQCPERVLPATCPVRPPDCPEGYFPEVVSGCFSGVCLHCIDGCQSDSDCMPVQACGCSYHEGCGWAETTYRLALETDECILPVGAACPRYCGGVPPCPPACEGDENMRCCGWCDPPDGAICRSGSCAEVITHPCM